MHITNQNQSFLSLVPLEESEERSHFSLPKIITMSF